ncbi:MAG: zf-HC2 domain-containing protein [Candidatus Rokubacteria bacterium]|nr:zf-HC2 domain-containing protein [Candidatus Rokubacteria bacterium]
MTCQETIAILADYLEGECGPEMLADLERHLADCAPCRAYLATYKRTRELTEQVGRVEMPEEMRRRLRQFLLDTLAKGEGPS